MSHLKFRHIIVELPPGGNVEVLKCELIKLALEHHCDVHAERNGGTRFYGICYNKLMTHGVPEDE